MLEYGTATVAVAQPRLTWRLGPGVEDWHQAGYEIELTMADGETTRTGPILDARCVFIPWPFLPLAPGMRGALRVRVDAVDGRSTAWSDQVEFSVGLLGRGDWGGQFVGPRADSDFRGVHHLRRRFQVVGRVRRAVLHVTALVLLLILNGQQVGDHVLDPGWTSYGRRI